MINLFILDHNFWSRNARKSIKGIKEYFGLVVGHYASAW